MATSRRPSIGGGDQIGPDLKDVSARREISWLTRFMIEPDRMRAEGDPLTLELSKKYQGVLMPNLGLEKNDVADLLDYIGAKSRKHDAQSETTKQAKGGGRG